MTAGRKRRLLAVGRVAFAVAATACGLVASGQPSARSTATSAAPFQPARPYWPELTIPQRAALAPLVTDWEHLDAQTKKKWVEIANRYPRMKPEEQSHAQERMREWAALTPDQRRVARDSFARIRALPPEARADVLRKYRELPPEKREALTQQSVRNKALIVPRAPVPTPAVTLARRAQIREGARVPNPAIAAAKSASPVVAPAVRPASASAAPGAVAAPAAVAPVTSTAVTPVPSSAVAPATSTAATSIAPPAPGTSAVTTPAAAPVGPVR